MITIIQQKYGCHLDFSEKKKKREQMEVKPKNIF